MTGIHRHSSRESLPSEDRADDHVQGHWMLARLGKRVLRPGGVQLTRELLDRAEVTNADVLRLAPGLGRTAAEILARQPRSYVGVEQDPGAAQLVRGIVTAHGDVRVADATATGLDETCADVVVGEAMLTLQGDTAKHAIVSEVSPRRKPVARGN